MTNDCGKTDNTNLKCKRCGGTNILVIRGDYYFCGKCGKVYCPPKTIMEMTS